MATTAILNANDIHGADQSPHGTSSPLARGFSPSQVASSYSFASASPAEASTASNCSSSAFSLANYPLQPTRAVYQNLTPEPPPSEGCSLTELGAASFSCSSTPANNSSADVIYIRDPFYEPPRKRTPNTQRPPQYANTGNPLYSGVQLELPRNLRVPYPESAFEAIAAANKTFANYGTSNGMCMQPRGIPMTYMASQLRSPTYAGHSIPNGMSPSYASPTPPPGGMSPSYPMHAVRHMPCPKPNGSQVSPAAYHYYPANVAPVPSTKKQSPLTTSKKAKQQAAKASLEERAMAKGSRKNEYNGPTVSNIYEQAADVGRPSTSTAPTYGMMPGMMMGNQVMCTMGGQPPSTSALPAQHMLQPGGRPPYAFDGAPMVPSASPLVPTNPSVGDLYGSLNGNIDSSPSYIQSNSTPLQRCGLCKEEVRSDRLSIQCTGNNQGCRQYYHIECSQLLPESFHAIMNEPRAEWICNECVRQQPILYT